MYYLDWKTDFFKLVDNKWQPNDTFQLRLKLDGKQASRLVRFNPFLQKPDELLSVRINNYHYEDITADREPETIEVPYEEVISKIEEKKRLIVLFTGGEPFFHKDFRKMMEYCKQNNIIVVVESNLPGFDNPEKAKEYADLIDMVMVPIYSYKEDVYESVTQIKGSYNKIFKALDNVEAFMPNTGLNFVTILTKVALSTLYDTIAFLYRRYENAPLFIGASCFDGPSHSKEISPSFSEMRDAYRAVVRDFGDRSITLYTPLCFMYPFHNRPHVGEIESIEYDGLGILENKPEDVFYDKMFESRYKPEGCKTCELDSLCKGFIELYTDIYNADDEIIPITNEKYSKCEHGNCERCGKQLNSDLVVLQTKFYVVDDGKVSYEQDEPLTRNLCLDCMDIVTNKLKYIKQRSLI